MTGQQLNQMLLGIAVGGVIVLILMILWEFILAGIKWLINKLFQ